MAALDAIARRYGVRPSSLIGERNEFKAFCVDRWAFQWGVQLEQYNRRRAVKRR